MILRYGRLYLNFLRFSFSRAMEFRVDFFFRIFMDILFYVINIAFYLIVYAHTSELGGWTQDEAMVFVGCYLFLDALSMTVLANNLFYLPVLINRGDLDYYLTRPVSPLFFLSLRDFAANSFVNLLVAVGLLAYFIAQYEGPATAGRILLLVMFLLVGAGLRYMVRMLTIIPVFWWQSGRGLEMIFYNMTRFVERPDRIFTGWVRRLLISVLPFALMASFPARMFLEKFDWLIAAHMLAVTVCFGFVLAGFWRAGLRAYSSASS